MAAGAAAGLLAKPGVAAAATKGGLTAGGGLIEAKLEAQQAERDRRLQAQLSGLQEQSAAYQNLAQGTRASSGQILTALANALR